MKLSRKDIRNLIIAGVVLIVIGLIIWRWKFKSDYVVTSITSTSTGAEAALYANLSLCQNTFVTNEYNNIAIHSNIWCSGSLVKATCDAVHGYSSGNLITVRGVSGDGTQTITGYNGDNMQISVVDSYTYTYTSPVACSQSGEANWTVFADNNNGTQGLSWLTSNPVTIAANVIRSNCFSDNVSTYISTSCPNSVSGYVPANGHSSYSAYQIYLANKQTIVNAYSKLINFSSSSSSPTRAQYEAARKADLTAALRKYLADACTDFYKMRGSSVDINPGSTDQTSNGYVLSPYTSYANIATSSSTTFSSSSKFDPALITAANVTNWATYAIILGGATGTKANYTTGGLASVFNVSGGEFPSGTKNSDVAAIIGPGTITRYGPITGATRTSGSITSFLTMATS